MVNVSSSSGRRPSGRLDASYSVTKAAQLSLSRVFADAFAARGVLVNAVTPGAVEGELWKSEGGLADQIAARTGSTREDVLAATRASPPLGRMGTDDEVAAVITFLCSERASNVAGAAWAVDGGSGARRLLEVEVGSGGLVERSRGDGVPGAVGGGGRRRPGHDAAAPTVVTVPKTGAPRVSVITPADWVIVVR